ncbi:hypothetical protein LJR267_000174 [Paraburkholderia hospita]
MEEVDGSKFSVLVSADANERQVFVALNDVPSFAPWKIGTTQLPK